MISVAIVTGRIATSAVLKKALGTLPQHEMAWLARDGHEALEKLDEQPVDIVLVDLDLSGMDSIECTRRIVERFTCAVVLVAAAGGGGYDQSFKAMAAGAKDVVELPREDGKGQLAGLGPFSNRLLKIPARGFKSAVSGFHRTETSGSLKTRGASDPLTSVAGSETDHLVVIGSSTGGPHALVPILQTLSVGSRPAVVIVQHLDVHFATGLAEWLTMESGFPVRLAREGEKVCAGQGYLAGTNDHLRMDSNGRLRYESEPLEYPYRPSVDVFFESVAQVKGKSGVAALLTGMGRDGARGLLALRESGWCTLAQDEATSAVYGMPRAAAQLGAAMQILALPDIGPMIVRKMRQRGGP